MTTGSLLAQQALLLWEHGQHARRAEPACARPAAELPVGLPPNTPLLPPLLLQLVRESTDLRAMQLLTKLRLLKVGAACTARKCLSAPGAVLRL